MHKFVINHFKYDLHKSISVFLLVLIFAYSCKENGRNTTSIISQEKLINKKVNSLLTDTIKVSKDSLTKIVNTSATDSTKNDLYFQISYNYYRNKDSSAFRYWNRLSNQLSIKLQDTSKIAESYWDLGNFFYQENVNDSSYYFYNKAYRLYQISDEKIMSGRMLLNMAIIQKNIKDYTGSEVTTIQAIKLLKDQNKDYRLFSAYNNLGIIYDELQENDKALRYHKKASNYGESSESLKSANLNNIGMVYHNSRSYDDAIRNFKKALSVDSLYIKDPTFYAMLLDNLAFSKLKSDDTLGIEDTFLTALKIRDSLNDESGQVINKLHLAEFYGYKKDTTKALNFAREAKNLAKKTYNFRDLLASLLLLSKIDAQNDTEYMSNYIAINDSLIQQERATRNKFARIRFETDEIVEENEMLYARQSTIMAISATFLLLGFLGYVIRDQRSKNKELLLKQEQHTANEKIYELLLEQQSVKEESRKTERKRIARELHDGIIGKLFGTRMGLGFLNIQGEKDIIEKHKTFIQELQKIEKEVRDISHDLEQTSLSSNLDFINLVENYLTEKGELGGFGTYLFYEKVIDWEFIENKTLINFFRLMQEALQNVLKHANAKRVEVDFSQKGKHLIMQVQDNGIGFNPGKGAKGIGLRNMEIRITEMGGSFQIESHPEKGTKLIFSGPIRNENSRAKFLSLDRTA